MPLDDTDVTQGYRALGAVGDAVMRAGSVIGAKVKARQDAREQKAILEAESEIDIANASLSTFYQKNRSNTAAWVPEAERLTADVAGKWSNDPRLTNEGRERLALRLKTWAETTRIHADGQGAIADFGETKGAFGQRIRSLMDGRRYDEVENLLPQLEASGVYYDFEVAGIRDDIGRAKKATVLSDAEQNYKRSLIVANESEMEAALKVGKQNGWTDSDIELLRTKGKLDIERNREVMQNREQHDFLADLSFRRAQGEVIAPSQVEGLVAAGKIDKDTGARMLLAAKSDVGALPGELKTFLDEVATYDPDDDSRYEKAAAFQRRAAEMGLRPEQAMQFNAVFETAQKENADVTKRIETAGLVAARQTIRSAYEKGGLVRTWTPDLAAALQDTAKLQAFGIPTAQAENIKRLMQGGKVDGKKVEPDLTAAFREFKAASITRADKSAAAKAGLSEWAYNLFEKAATSDTDANATDPQKAMEAAFDQETTTRRMEEWFKLETKKNGTPPDDMAVKKKTGEFLSSKLQGKATRSLLPKRGGVGSDISVRGFTPAPDLADKLPPGLKPYAKAFEEAGKAHGLDPYALAAISMHETANGTSSAFVNKRNAMGISDSTGPVAMDSVEDSIKRQAATLARADGPYSGADDVATIGGVYAPVGAENDPRQLNGFWASGVSKYYRQLRD
jgi:hypothetical protein